MKLEGRVAIWGRGTTHIKLRMHCWNSFAIPKRQHNRLLGCSRSNPWSILSLLDRAMEKILLGIVILWEAIVLKDSISAPDDAPTHLLSYPIRLRVTFTYAYSGYVSFEANTVRIICSCQSAARYWPKKCSGYLWIRLWRQAIPLLRGSRR